MIFFQKIEDIGILGPINQILRTQNKPLTERCLLSKAPFKRLLFPPFHANQLALLVTQCGGGSGGGKESRQISCMRSEVTYSGLRTGRDISEV